MIDAIGRDEEFFKDNPGRSHRVRRAFPSESLRLLSMPLAPGQAWFVTVRKVRSATQQEPGAWLHLIFSGWTGLPTNDVDEELARTIFEHYARVLP